MIVHTCTCTCTFLRYIHYVFVQIFSSKTGDADTICDDVLSTFNWLRLLFTSGTIRPIPRIYYSAELERVAAETAEQRGERDTRSTRTCTCTVYLGNTSIHVIKSLAFMLSLLLATQYQQGSSFPSDEPSFIYYKAMMPASMSEHSNKTLHFFFQSW